MNLAFLVGRFPPGPIGGAELQAEGWARRLSDRHRITVVTRRDGAHQPERETRDGFEVRRLPVSTVPLVRTALDLARIDRELASIEPRPELMLCFQTFISGLAGVRHQRRTGIPAVVWIRGEGEYRLGRSAKARWFGPRVWREARAVLVQTEANHEALLEELARFAPGLRESIAAKLDVVPNGLDLPPSASARGARVLVVGRLIREKGTDVAIDAVAGMQGQLTVAGDGPERAALEARARHHGLDARFEGFVGRERLSALYRESMCLVLASRSGEGLPNVVLEAFGHGLPVVATPVAGVRDLVRHDENGLLVPPDDPLALRDALARLASERGLAERLGRAARATAEEFSWDRVRPRLEQVLDRWGPR